MGCRPRVRRMAGRWWMIERWLTDGIQWQIILHSSLSHGNTDVKSGKVKILLISYKLQLSWSVSLSNPSMKTRISRFVGWEDSQDRLGQTTSLVLSVGDLRAYVSASRSMLDLSRKICYCLSENNEGKSKVFYSFSRWLFVTDLAIGSNWTFQPLNVFLSQESRHWDILQSPSKQSTDGLRPRGAKLWPPSCGSEPQWPPITQIAAQLSTRSHLQSRCYTLMLWMTVFSQDW